MKKTVVLSLLLAVATLFTIPAAAQTVTRTSGANFQTFQTATFSAISANGSTAVFDSGYVFNKYTLSCVPTGAPTTANVILEGSLDGTNFFTVVTTAACTVFVAGSGIDKPARYFRGTLSGLAGGTTPSVALRMAATR